MVVLSDQEILALHEKYSPTREAFDLVYTHSRIVWAVAEQLLGPTNRGFDPGVVRTGSLLHDIGVYLLYKPSGELDHEGYVRHGVLGHELLAKEGFPEETCRFCSCHTGVGLSREDVHAQGLPIPIADYMARSEEEELVMYADKFHSKTDPPVFVSADTCAASLNRFGEDKKIRFEMMRKRFGEPDLAPLTAAYGYGLV